MKYPSVHKISSDGKTILAGDFLWDPFGANGGGELSKYSTDTHGKVKV